MEDCIEAMRSGIKLSELSSNYERASFKRFLVLCCEVAEIVRENHEDLNVDDAVAAYISEECTEEVDNE